MLRSRNVAAHIRLVRRLFKRASLAVGQIAACAIGRSPSLCSRHEVGTFQDLPLSQRGRRPSRLGRSRPNCHRRARPCNAPSPFRRYKNLKVLPQGHQPRGIAVQHEVLLAVARRALHLLPRRRGRQAAVDLRFRLGHQGEEADSARTMLAMAHRINEEDFRPNRPRWTAR